MNKYIGSTPVVTQVDGYNRTEADAEFVDVTGDTVTGSLTVDQDLTVDTNTLYVDSANNRVGIGTSSPGTTLDVGGNFRVFGSGATAAVNLSSTSTLATIKAGASSTTQMSFETGGSEAMRLDSSGNVGIGTSSPSTTLDVNRSGDGNVVAFSEGGSAVGYVLFRSSGQDLMLESGRNLQFRSNEAGIERNINFTNEFFAPFGVNDDSLDLGRNSARWDDIFATNGTIQTSDRNEKQDIEALSDAEARVAVACKGLMRKFRWKSAVEEKGDDARIHFGIIAQDLQDAFAAEGLDAGRYGMFISSTWWEAEETYTDDDGVEQTRTNTYDTLEAAPEGAIERTRMGVRYPELLAFIIAAI